MVRVAVHRPVADMAEGSQPVALRSGSGVARVVAWRSPSRAVTLVGDHRSDVPEQEGRPNPGRVLGRGSMAGARDVDGVVVRRAGPWTPAVHAWLRHLLAAGVDAVPRPLGLAGGVERQQLLPGEPGWHPPHPAVRADHGLRQLAAWVRASHAAVAGFDPGPVVWASGRRGGPAVGEVVVHGDLGMWNTLWDADRLTGVVDLDLAEPGPAWWDWANLAWAAVPVVRLDDDRPPRDGWVPDQQRRLRVLADALGCGAAVLLDHVGAWLDVQVARRTSAVPAGPLWRELVRSHPQQADELARQRDWVSAGAPGLR